VSRTPAGGHGLKKNSVLRCFAVFCDVVRCFVCVFLTFFYKTAQNRPKNIQNAQNEQNTLCAIQRNTVLCVFLSLRKCRQNIRKTRPKLCKTSAKHRKTPQNTVFRKPLAKHRKTPAKQKHPQNTAKQKHCKTPQNRFANKTDQIS